jgi:predicted alpha/beta-fold hydrolase
MTKKTSNHTKSLKIPKLILQSSKLISFFLPKLAILFAAKLFTSPIKHKIPKRELEMDSKSTQTLIEIPKINKKVVLYQYGESNKKNLLVHGWSGARNTTIQSCRRISETGYSTICFDARAHGKYPEKLLFWINPKSCEKIIKRNRIGT